LLEYCARLKRRDDAVLPPELEPELWRLAAAVYGQSLCGIVREALGRYRRRPGHDDMTRIYWSNVGLEGFSILRECLINDPGNDDPSADFLSVRAHKRWYVHGLLLRKLVCDGFGTDVMRDALAATDLGL
jgi:hypothetical protein